MPATVGVTIVRSPAMLHIASDIASNTPHHQQHCQRCFLLPARLPAMPSIASGVASNVASKAVCCQRCCQQRPVSPALSPATSHIASNIASDTLCHQQYRQQCHVSLAITCCIAGNVAGDRLFIRCLQRPYKTSKKGLLGSKKTNVWRKVVFGS